MYYYLLGVMAGLERREGPHVVGEIRGRDRWKDAKSILDEVGVRLRRLGQKKNTRERGGSARSRHAREAPRRGLEVQDGGGGGGGVDSEYEYSIASYTFPSC